MSDADTEEAAKNEKTDIILVLDDNPVNLHLAKRMLGKKTDITVVGVQTAEKSLEILKDDQFNVVGVIADNALQWDDDQKALGTQRPPELIDKMVTQEWTLPTGVHTNDADGFRMKPDGTTTYHREIKAVDQGRDKREAHPVEAIGGEGTQLLRIIRQSRRYPENAADPQYADIQKKHATVPVMILTATTTWDKVGPIIDIVEGTGTDLRSIKFPLGEQSGVFMPLPGEGETDENSITSVAKKPPIDETFDKFIDRVNAYRAKGVSGSGTMIDSPAVEKETDKRGV